MHSLKNIANMESLIEYFSNELNWKIDYDDFEDIDDITYEFDAEDLGLKEESFAKIISLKQLRPLVDTQQWGIFFVEFDSQKFEVSALRKILSGLIPSKRNSAFHAVWDMKDLLFICTWGNYNDKTIGIAHFEDSSTGLPQIKMISCNPSVEDFTQIGIFESKLNKLMWPNNTNNLSEWKEKWSAAFTVKYRQVIQDAHTVTVRLAEEAQCIRNRILEILDVETKNGYVHLLFDKFRNTLVQDMKSKEFADMYAQTIVYGLFSARCMDDTQEDFSVLEAIECIPITNPFLKGLLRECFDTKKSKGALAFDELGISDIVELLRNTHTDSIITDFNRQTGGGKEDPVIHFYEEFLNEYDKSQKVQRGVYYTPQPVVNFIVKSVDDILKNEFNYKDGLATVDTKNIKIMRDSKRKIDGYIRKIEDNTEVQAAQILDPATGTGTFLRQVIIQIYNNFSEKNKNLSSEEFSNKWNDYVDNYLLTRINGFELMMAPYAVAHMKLAMVLKDTGYNFKGKNRLNVFLTNSLEEAGNSSNQLTLFDDPLALESVEANIAKKNKGINIVIGNPPYSGESANKGPWIKSLMERYKKEPGGKQKLQEKNPKWLNDDYVKFICYAQNIIDNSEDGIVAFINPHGFITNPTFRGMRWSLMDSFNDIYIIDLHGNSNRKETCPDGSKDENVFDIKQGVCISLLVKNKSKNKKCRVWHADMYGTRNEKYKNLQNLKLTEIPFVEIFPKEPECLFSEVVQSLKNEYDNGFSVNELFELGSVGLITARDKLNLGFNKYEVMDRLEDFRKLDIEVARSKYNLGKDVRDWKVDWAQNDINQNAIIDDAIDEDKIIPIMYRPFDIRYMLYTGHSRGLVCYPRSEVTEHFMHGVNLGLSTGRSNKSTSCDHFIAVKNMIEVKCSERTTGSIIYPLYLYTYLSGKYLRTVNMNKGIIKEVEKKLCMKYVQSDDIKNNIDEFTEVDLFDYIYGILYSRKYRDKYDDFLKSDYPKIPYPKSKSLFKQMVVNGHKLVQLHTMQCKSRREISIFVDNGRLIEKIVFKNHKIYINKKSYFDNISEELWGFVMGGYQPLSRWYKDRKGCEISDKDIKYYLQMINVIDETIHIMDDIDKCV